MSPSTELGHSQTLLAELKSESPFGLGQVITTAFEGMIGATQNSSCCLTEGGKMDSLDTYLGAW